MRIERSEPERFRYERVPHSAAALRVNLSGGLKARKSSARPVLRNLRSGVKWAKPGFPVSEEEYSELKARNLRVELRAFSPRKRARTGFSRRAGAGLTNAGPSGRYRLSIASADFRRSSAKRSK